jgi:reverse gyrase
MSEEETMERCVRCGGEKTSEQMVEGGICESCRDDIDWPELNGKEFKE